MDINKLTVDEKVEFLRENPIFWSRLGFEREVGGWQPHVKNAYRHKALFEKGIVVHSSIIPVGWVGPDSYDYTDTDKYLELLFSTCPDIVFLPRVKVNVPEGWCQANPDDVFVYGCGPRKREDIVSMIGTFVHGSHPQKKTDMIAQQSFFSKKWVSDGCEALRRFIEHVENSKWADRIIGYHIAYGTSGETTQWGTWYEDPYHKGDYGINATKAFIEYAKARGEDYDCVPPIEERFYIEDGGEVLDFQIGTPTLDKLFLHTEQDKASVLYAEFNADGNMDALESFCKTVKQSVPDKLAGVFYGYLIEPLKCANMQHCGYDRLLDSPYIDFVASPKGYVRVGPTDPGLGQAVCNSVNRKKLWVDEIDNRTHLAVVTRPKYDHPAKNFDQTRAVYWREFTKNVVHHQGYWWMDLGGGWLDDESIQNEIMMLNNMSKQLYLERDSHESVAEVLLLINEKTFYHMRPNAGINGDAIHHIGCTVKESGVPIDLYRTADLDTLDLSRYKLIIFLNEFYADRKNLEKVLSKTAQDCHIMWNYCAGIIDADGSYGLHNVKELTGFDINERPIDAKGLYYPRISVAAGDGISAEVKYSDGGILLAKKKHTDGRTHILCGSPADMTVDIMRKLFADAGVHIYSSPYCTVHTDNRFLYLLSQKEQTVEIDFKQKTTCRNVFTDELYCDITRISLDMKEGTCVFLKYGKEK